MIIVIIVNALITAIVQYIDKHIIKKGISKDDYFYYMCLSMLPFAALMIIVEGVLGNLRFEINLIPIGLLIVAMYLRYYRQHAVYDCLTDLNPFEISTYMSLRDNFSIFNRCYIWNKKV